MLELVRECLVHGPSMHGHCVINSMHSDITGFSPMGNRKTRRLLPFCLLQSLHGGRCAVYGGGSKEILELISSPDPSLKRTECMRNVFLTSYKHSPTSECVSPVIRCITSWAFACINISGFESVIHCPLRPWGYASSVHRLLRNPQSMGQRPCGALPGYLPSALTEEWGDRSPSKCISD
jgi:hypothetical protein